jgi:hypothetical protein
MEFFPANSLDLGPEPHAFRDRWYVSHLLAMQERPLYPPAADVPPVYRLLFLPTFRQPVAVRLSDSGGVWRAVCKRSDGRGGYGAGQLTAESERELSRAEAKQFARRLNRVGFWDMPSSEETAGLDGSQAVFEGARDGRYHVVDRWSPHGTPYAELVEFLLGLARGVGELPLDPPKYLGSFAELAERLKSQPDGPGAAEPQSAPDTSRRSC